MSEKKVKYGDSIEPRPEQGEAVRAATELEMDVIYDKKLRVGLDEQLQKLKGLRPSRERSLSITNLQQSIMWLGMDLKRLNEPNPYPDSYDPSNTKIAPTADGMKM